jgi:CubicO group peptidase (beta-lactamase class C family)
MKLNAVLCLLLLTTMHSICLADESAPPASGALPRSTPEKEGISSSAILSFVQAADAKVDAMHSFMLVRHGQVVAEGWWSPCGPTLPHTMFSLSKSFTSTAVGLAIADGKLSLDDPVVKFFPEDAPAQPSDNLKAMRVRDLLVMSSGQHADVVSQFKFDTNEPLTREFLALPVEHKPGTFWFYNTPGSYMLSAIVQKATGLTVLDYLRPRLFEPLGMENPTWETSPQGISLGGYGLHIKTEDIAKFGLLYLNKGQWHGKQLVPAAWVAAATARQSSNGSNPQSDWEQGYGYQFWQCRHGLYRGDGAFGQFCIVMPEQDAVVAMTAGTTNLATMMNLVWDFLLPALQDKSLRADAPALEKLHAALAGLTLHPTQGSAASAAVGMSGRKFLFPANDQKVESLSLEFGMADGSATLGMRCNGVDQKIQCGHNTWVKGRTTFVSDVMHPPADQPVAASGAWTADGVFTLKLAFYETPFCATLTFRFEGDQLFYNAEYNAVRRPPAKWPTLIGRAAN